LFIGFHGEHDSFWKNKKKRKIVIWLVVLALLIVSGTAGFILASNEPRVVQITPAPSDLPAAADDSKIAKGAVVKWEYEYRMCGHIVYLSCMADDHIIGLTFSQLQAEYPDARIISFEPEMVSLKLGFDCYCPRHYILKRYKEELAVLRTILGSDEQETYRKVPVRFDDLSADEQEVLEAGKLFESIDELEYYIENLET
jgi:hypothetical protein